MKTLQALFLFALMATGLVPISSELFLVGTDSLHYSQLNSSLQATVRQVCHQKSRLLYNGAVKVSSAYPDSAMALIYNNRGKARFLKGSYQNAIADFDLAIKYNARYALALNNRAAAYFKLKAYKKAIDDLNKAIAKK